MRVSFNDRVDIIGGMAKQIVALGGGTGTPVVLAGLKNDSDIALSAIVVVTDSGGSTGRLRDEFGFLPVGDVRQCITALADDNLAEEIRQLLLYRFGGKSALKGHSLGNLILTAFEDLEQSPGKAIETVSRIFQTNGKIFPVTESVADLVIEYDDGSKETGEHFLDDHTIGGKQITKLSLTEPSPFYPPAAKALKQADLIILGPGDLYGSLIPHSLTTGFNDALQQSTAPFVYVVNLMTHFSQTHNMTASDHVAQITRYFGRQPDVVVINNAPIPAEILAAYEHEKEYPVKDDLNGQGFKVIRGNFISEVAVKLNSNDAIKRSLLRHDIDKLTAVLRDI